MFARKTETAFRKTFKTFTNFVWVEMFCVKRKNITIKINIWIIFRIKKIIIHFKRIILHRFEVCFRSHLSFFTDLIFEKSCKITQNYALSLCDHYFVQYQLMSALFNTSLCLFRSAFLGFLL